MSGSFSKSKQQSSSQSTSDSTQLGLNEASSFGTTGSSSTSSSVGGSSQSIAFEDLFRKLYGGATDAAAGIDTGGVSGAANMLFSGGLDFLKTLSSNPGTDALTARATDNTARDAQLEALKMQLGDFFNEQVLPGVTSRGVAAGAFGSDRDTIARAQAAKAVAGQFSTGAASIIASDQAGKDAAATSLAGITGSNSATALNALSSLFSVKEAGANATLEPYTALAQILGGPTALTTSSSIADAISSSFGEQGSKSYGFDFGTSSSQSTSQGTGSSFGISGGIGFAPPKG